MDKRVIKLNFHIANEFIKSSFLLYLFKIVISAIELYVYFPIVLTVYAKYK
jgi:hypothetical protein